MSHRVKQCVFAVPVLVGAIVLGFAITGQHEVTEVKKRPLKPVPAQYANKHMPEAWWTDPKVIKEGEEIYHGKKYGKHNVSKEKRVKCAKCHGKVGKPKGKGPRDMRSAKAINRMSDSYWFWRISEGVKKTKMKSWKTRLTEEEIWQVMAYEHMFSHGKKPAVHDHPEIERGVAGVGAS